MNRNLPCVFLILFLMGISFSTATAIAQSEGNEDILTERFMHESGLAENEMLYTQGLDWEGDTFYAYLTDLSVYTVQPDGTFEKLCQLPDAPKNLNLIYENMSDEQLETLKNTVTYIVSYDGALYGYNVYSERFGAIDAEGIHWGDVTLDLSCLNPDDNFFPNRVARSFLTDQRLYTFVDLMAPNAEFSYSFYGFDRATGESTAYEIGSALGVCHEAGENFLFLRLDEDGYVISRLDAENREN